MGDVVHAVPTLVELRKRYPAAQIDWLITPENAELVRHHPDLSGIVLFDRRAFRGMRGLAGLPGLVEAIRHGGYDLAVDLHGQLRSALFSLVSGARVRVGFDRPRRSPSPESPGGGKAPPRRGWAGAREGAWLGYTHRIPIPTLQVHALDRYLWLGGVLGFVPGEPQQRLYLDPQAGEKVSQKLREHGVMADEPFAVVSPSTMWETKHWRSRGFGEVARELALRGWCVLLVGGKGDHSLCEALKQHSPQAINLAGETSPGELAELVRRSRLCVANDSAVSHLAVAMQRPLAAIYGPTNPVTVGPYRRAEAVVRLDLPCSPCNFRRLVQCPHGHACMEQLTVDEVLRKIEAVL